MSSPSRFVGGRERSPLSIPASEPVENLVTSRFQSQLITHLRFPQSRHRCCCHRCYCCCRCHRRCRPQDAVADHAGDRDPQPSPLCFLSSSFPSPTSLPFFASPLVFLLAPSVVASQARPAHAPCRYPGCTAARGPDTATFRRPLC